MKEFSNVGRIIFNRPHSVAPPESKYLTSTLFQLLASNILCLVVNKNSNDDGDDITSQLNLQIRQEDMMPHYLLDNFWKDIDLVSKMNMYIYGL